MMPKTKDPAGERGLVEVVPFDGQNGTKISPTARPFQVKTDPRRALLEVRHARLRLALTDVDLEWAARCLADGTINPDAALGVLDDAMDALAQGGPWP